jgi:hypothetical protein
MSYVLSGCILAGEAHANLRPRTFIRWIGLGALASSFLVAQDLVPLDHLPLLFQAEPLARTDAPHPRFFQFHCLSVIPAKHTS